MRRLKIAPPVQLQLVPPAAPAPSELWAGLPDATKDRVLALLARLVMRGVLADDEEKEMS